MSKLFESQAASGAEKTTTVDAESASVAVGEAANSLDTLDATVVRSLKRKADFILLPMLAVMYLFNSLDRSNMGNAQTDGLSRDLHLKGNQYNLVLTFYYVFFVIFGPASGMVTKKVTARYSLPGMMMCFGTASATTASVKNFGGLMTCRIMVGIFEAGFLTSVVYYLSTWYTRSELAARIGIFYAASVAASAFGGLLAFGMFQIKDGKLFSWAYLFILEGCLTVLIASIALVVLPESPRKAFFLTEQEKDVAEQRILLDSVEYIENRFVWSEALSEFKSPHIYIRMVLMCTAGILVSSNGNFLAIITARLQYSVVKTNLYTVAPALVAAVILVALCVSSDHFRERGYHIAIGLSFSLIGYIILATIDVEKQKGIAYMAIFFMTAGAYPTSPLGTAWTVTNITNLNARALTSGIVIACGNAAGLIASNIFFTDEAPRYITALAVNAAMSGVALVISFTYSTWMRYENRRRDNIYGKEEYVTVGVTSTRDPRFRFQP
ncbi:hypothetical protein A1O1_05838 [Capronia coronata CBS 617.96]|uniref:Major facilitator superfamily (MFS) profile domain-containing protein n=1 Tax=Capronia coronata CBS 617.96 TaxID=1182541 RepID=W9YT68_9EURO|nr:uncharacterized protein A1O1_05838 [Capronia coronata CBS 617.96]EXJ85474.1 hypothetical protein A1O1_05838 [Capronia coronata CBS 617.96]